MRSERRLRPGSGSWSFRAAERFLPTRYLVTVAEAPQIASASGELTSALAVADRLITNIERVVLGKHDEITLALSALTGGGHVLLEDVPGTAKTILARSIAQTIEGASFARIQCTPDLQPTDVTGLAIYNQKTREFEFRPGPIFANIVLVDEINRAMPRTQSALLEAMAERQVTIDGVTRTLPSPFLVIATENPIEQEGTFPLPEAQLDRFAMRSALGYPQESEEIEIVLAQRHGHPIANLQPRVTAEDPARARPPAAADPVVRRRDAGARARGGAAAGQGALPGRGAAPGSRLGDPRRLRGGLSPCPPGSGRPSRSSRAGGSSAFPSATCQAAAAATAAT